MRSWLVVLFALLCPPVLAQQPQMPPVIRFDSVPDPLKLPADLYLGEVSGIAVNSKGHIFVLSRGNTTGPAYAAAAAQLLEFGPVADAWPGRIYKLTLDGRVLGVLGESGKQLKQFGWIHEVACPSENVLWVGELLN